MVPARCCPGTATILTGEWKNGTGKIKEKCDGHEWLLFKKSFRGKMKILSSRRHLSFPRLAHFPYLCDNQTMTVIVLLIFLLPALPAAAPPLRFVTSTCSLASLTCIDSFAILSKCPRHPLLISLHNETSPHSRPLLGQHSLLRQYLLFFCQYLPTSNHPDKRMEPARLSAFRAKPASPRPAARRSTAT